MYEYTKPRQPIAATYSSPGPCYPLPNLVGYNQHDPRSVHRKYPAWQFGVKHGRFTNDCSPGPVHYPDVEITRYGKDGTPRFSLYGRPRDLTTFRPPGPGAYSPESSGPCTSRHAPSFSFGDRTKLRNTDSNPSPNTYTLPALLGRTVEGGKTQSPMYTQRGRSNQGGFSEDLTKTPGPGAYGSMDPNLWKRKGPSYTLRGRSMMPGDSTRKPGPGAHSPENVRVNKGIQPSYSFGIRHSQYTTPMIAE